MGISTPNIPTYDNRYKYDIQMQFANDENFASWCQVLANMSTQYINTLYEFSQAININVINNTSLTQEQQIYALNCIGSLLGVKPYEFFVGEYGSEFTLDLYLLIIKGAQANRQYDGTNNFIITTLAQLFDGTQYQFIVEDNQDMSITVLLIADDISGLDVQLFQDGLIVPKPAGVNVTVTATALEPSYWNDDSLTGTPSTGTEEYKGAWGVTIWGNINS